MSVAAMMLTLQRSNDDDDDQLTGRLIGCMNDGMFFAQMIANLIDFVVALIKHNF